MENKDICLDVLTNIMKGDNDLASAQFKQLLDKHAAEKISAIADKTDMVEKS